MNGYRFPEQNVLCAEMPVSKELLGILLEQVYEATLPFTGYMRFTCEDAALLFLFFFNGAPYAAGKFVDGKSFSYSILEFAQQLDASAGRCMTVALCETDPVLLKNMLLILQEVPAIKAPTTLFDMESFVRQVCKAGSPAMIALCSNKTFNFFYFRDGKGVHTHYGDPLFEKPSGMTVDEEMLLFAYQPETTVEAYVFRTMVTTEAKDAAGIDRKTLSSLLLGGEIALTGKEATARTEARTPAVAQPQKQVPSVNLTVDSGPQCGESFVVTLPCTIGRKNCDLNLNDGQVSRRHAELRIVEKKLMIVDLESTNGTKVNGESVTLKQLAPKDLITIGETVLKITPPDNPHSTARR